MKNCIFCKIIKKEIPSEIIYEDNNIVAFADINPKAPVHILIVPKKHIPTVDDFKKEDSKIIGAMVLVAQKIARKQKLAKNGYRLVFNVRFHGGQVVNHIHLHLLGGKPLGKMC